MSHTTVAITEEVDEKISEIRDEQTVEPPKSQVVREAVQQLHENEVE